jgi:NAD(P)H dehydrogenase (quinone)
MEPVKVLVVYDSRTGNVEAMAGAVAKGGREEGAIVTLRKVDDVEVDEIPTYDAFAFGSPTHCGTMTTKMNDFFNRKIYEQWGKLNYKVAVAFTSSGGLGGGNEVTLLSMISAILNFGMMTFGIPDYASPGVTLHYGAVAVGKPDKNSLRACEILGKRLVEHARVIKSGLYAHPS